MNLSMDVSMEQGLCANRIKRPEQNEQRVKEDEGMMENEVDEKERWKTASRLKDSKQPRGLSRSKNHCLTAFPVVVLHCYDDPETSPSCLHLAQAVPDTRLAHVIGRAGVDPDVDGA